MEKSNIIRKERVLHFPGEVLVKEGQTVEPSTPIARTVYIPIRPFFVEVAAPLGISPEEVRKYLLKKEGDEVKIGDILARRRGKLEIEGRMRRSPVEGVIEQVSSLSGHIIIREKVEDLSPRKIDTAKALGVAPNEAKRYIKKRVGELVEKGGAIAEIPIRAGLSLRICESPIFGEIKKIDELSGEVILERPHKRIELLSMLQGVVPKIVPQYGAVIELEAYYLYGVIGFGGERWGRLTTEEPLDGEVFISKEPLSALDMSKMEKKGVRGIIFEQVRASEMEKLFGDEVYSGVTGKMDKGITIVILGRFGVHSMDKEKFDFFRSLKGRYTYINGKTQIRAGVIRPEIIISRKNKEKR